MIAAAAIFTIFFTSGTIFKAQKSVGKLFNSQSKCCSDGLMCVPNGTGEVNVSDLIVSLAEIGAILTLSCILLICHWKALRHYCNSTNVDRLANCMCCNQAGFTM